MQTLERLALRGIYFFPNTEKCKMYFYPAAVRHSLLICWFFMQSLLLFRRFSKYSSAKMQAHGQHFSGGVEFSCTKIFQLVENSYLNFFETTICLGKTFRQFCVRKFNPCCKESETSIHFHVVRVVPLNVKCKSSFSSQKKVSSQEKHWNEKGRWR